MWIITIVILYVTYCMFLSCVITFWRNTSTWGSPILTETSNMYIPMYLPNGEKAYTWSVYSLLLLTHTFVCRMGKSNVYYTGKSHMLSSNVTNGHYMNRFWCWNNIKVFECLLLPTESNIKPKNLVVLSLKKFVTYSLIKVMRWL